MKALAAILVFAGCHGCGASQPPPPPAPTDQTVFEELVLAQCMSADAGVAAVASEHASPNPQWMRCLYGGGNPLSCNAPCGRDAGAP